MKNRLLVMLILSCCIVGGCGEYEKLAIEKESQRMADSLFRAHRDSLTSMADSLCGVHFTSYYNEAIDSIKETQLVKIKKLIEK